MALKILKKAKKTKKTAPVKRPTLPEGADRFLWTEIPPQQKNVEYARILKKKPSS